MRRVIGINGDIGSGKDTLFSLLPTGTIRLAFGDKLKEEVDGFLRKQDVSQVLQFLAAHKCSFEHVLAILQETWGAVVEPHDYPFLRTILENEGGRVACDSFVKKHRSLRVSSNRWGDHLQLAESGLLVRLMHDRKEKEQFRTLMKWWGTEYRRGQFRDDYWLQFIRDEIEKHPEGTLFAITDPRFPNEFEFVQIEYGGLLLRIEREGTEGTRNHASDTSWVGWPFDAVVDNNGTIGDLADQVPSLLHALDIKQRIIDADSHEVVPLIEELRTPYTNSGPEALGSKKCGWRHVDPDAPRQNDGDSVTLTTPFYETSPFSKPLL